MNNNDVANRLKDWAEKREKIDKNYTIHGRDCLEAAEEIEFLRKELNDALCRLVIKN